MTDLVCHAPLKIFQTRPGFPGEENRDMASLVLSNYGGGFLQGDDITLSVCTGENSSLYLRSQGNTHIFRNDNNRPCTCTVLGRVCSGAETIVRPEPLVLHRKAILHQRQRWSVDKDGFLILSDWFQSGRSDSGECFEFSEYSSEIEIEYNGKRIVIERFRCKPEVDDPYGYASFMGMNHLVNLYLIGKKSEQYAVRLQGLKNPAGNRVRPFHDGRALRPAGPFFSLSPLPLGGGYLFRAVAHARLDFYRMVFEELLGL